MYYRWQLESCDELMTMRATHDILVGRDHPFDVAQADTLDVLFEAQP